MRTQRTTHVARNESDSSKQDTTISIYILVLALAYIACRTGHCGAPQCTIVERYQCTTFTQMQNSI
jgi:hypothetical protein